MRQRPRSRAGVERRGGEPLSARSTARSDPGRGDDPGRPSLSSRRRRDPASARGRGRLAAGPAPRSAATALAARRGAGSSAVVVRGGCGNCRELAAALEGRGGRSSMRAFSRRRSGESSARLPVERRRPSASRISAALAGELSRSRRTGALAGGPAAPPSDLLLAGLIKDEEGFMSRHVERKISLAMSAAASPATSVTPNQMTLVARRDRPRRRGASSCVATAGASSRRRAALPPPLDPRRLRRRAGAPEVPGVALRRRARLLGRQRRPLRGLRRHGDRLGRATGQTWPLLLGAVAVAGTLALRRPRLPAHDDRRPRKGPSSRRVATAAGRPARARRRRAVAPRLHLSRPDTVRLRQGRAGSSCSRPSAPRSSSSCCRRLARNGVDAPGGFAPILD